jgi:hypothetical protein
MPLIHKYRYYASLDLAPHMRPPVCLRYAMWTMAASLSDKYTHYEDILYRRSRKYIEAAEMKVSSIIFAIRLSLTVLGVRGNLRYCISRAGMGHFGTLRSKEYLFLAIVDEHRAHVPTSKHVRTASYRWR